MLLTEDRASDDPKYDPQLGEDDPQLIIVTFLEFKKQVLEMSKVGQAAGPTDQGPALEDTAGITYEE